MEMLAIGLRYHCNGSLMRARMDSPRQFDINPETYKSMLLQLFGVEKKRKKSDFQLILTTRDLPEELEPFVIERLNSKNRMLLREEGQREQSFSPW